VKISIITPVYNDPRVAGALDSVLSQNVEAELELIVIDGSSTDGSLEVLERYRDDGRLAVLVSEPDRGMYDAINKGIALATGDIVGILNADDRYADTAVLRDVIAAFKNSHIEACYGDLVYVDDDDQVVRYWRSGECSRWKFHLGWAPPHPTFFVRKNVYERLGIFDMECFRIAADYELMLRFLMKNRVPVAYVDRVLVRMTVGGMSNRSVRNIMKANLEVYRAWRRNRLPLGQLAPVLKPAQKLLQFLQRHSEPYQARAQSEE
jgi:glycosyltransferase involved in cell wall biosynthesis